MARRGNGEWTIFKRQDGRWVAIVSMPGGTRKHLYGRTREEVAGRLPGALVAARDHQPLPPERLRASAYLTQWLAGVEPQVRHSTFIRYRSAVVHHLVPGLDGLLLARLQPTQVQGLYSQLAARGLAPRTIRTIHAIVCKALRAAYRQGLTSRSLPELLTPPRVPNRVAQPLTPEQARQLLDVARGHRLGALIALALATGMRLGELLALQWADVDLDAGVLRVQRSLARVKGALVLCEVKTARARRQIALSPSSVQTLRQHQAAQHAERLRVGAAWAKMDLVFASQVGTFLQATHVADRVLRPLLARAGLPRIRFHDLRHTAATLLLTQNVPAKVVSELLGHASVAITLDIYSHVLPDMQSSAAMAMERVLGG